MQVTDELRVLVEAEVDRAIKALEKTDKQLETTEKKTQELGKALDSMSGIANKVMTIAFSGAGIAAIKFAGDLEQTRTSLEVLLKSADKATEIQQQWVQFAAATPFQTDDINKAGKALLAFGVGADEVTETLRRIGDISAGVGASISSIAEIYGKAKVQGRLFAEDINQFQGRGIPVVQALAKAMGTTEKAVKELVANGKVGFEELQQAFVILTADGGQFGGMMEKLSATTLGKFSTATDNAKLALASFGELLLPLANEMLDAATGILQGLQDMDDGTKRFILTFGGVVAASGPVILAINGINKAVMTLAANPVILGVAGVVAGVALITAAVNKNAHAYEDLNNKIESQNKKAQTLLQTYGDGNDAKKLDAQTTSELIKLYPELSGQIDAYKMSVADASEAVRKLNEQKVIDAANEQIKKLISQAEAAEKAAAAYDKYAESAEENKRKARVVGDEGEVLDIQAALESYDRQMDKAAAKAAQTKEQINASLATIGKQLSGEYKIIDLPVTLTVDTTDATEQSSASTKKKWQTWFEEITKIEAKDFGESGSKAATLYLQGMEKGFNQSEYLSQILGEKFDLASVIESQQKELQKTIASLFAIDPNDIDIPFKANDKSVEPLIEQYRQLKDLSVQHEIDEINKAIANLAKTEGELAIQTSKANGYTEEQAQALLAANNEFDRQEVLAEYARRVEQLGLTQDDLARKTLIAKGATEQELQAFDQMVKKLEETQELSWQDQLEQMLLQSLEKLETFEAEANKMLANVGANLLSTSFDAAIDGFTEMGKALAEGADAADSMGAALAAMAQQILNQLPMMFLQAGLQLIAQGQWPLGLGFVAAAGSSAIISGFVQGKTSTATENAKGGAYDSAGVSAYANGGTFTNAIVSSPTHFRYAKGGGFGLGVMGEAGPEAIMPLHRGADGSLGIRADRMGSSVQVTMPVVINNYSDAQVTAKETTDQNGQRKLEITVGTMINQHLATGKADKALSGRYGLKAQGV